MKRLSTFFGKRARSDDICLCILIYTGYCNLTFYITTKELRRRPICLRIRVVPEYIEELSASIAIGSEKPSVMHDKNLPCTHLLWFLSLLSLSGFNMAKTFYSSFKSGTEICADTMRLGKTRVLAFLSYYTSILKTTYKKTCHFSRS
jgi:hypothetical protein